MLKRTLSLCLLLALMVTGVSAQVLINQSPTDLRACTMTATATAASNAAATATLTPPSGQYVYVCSIYIVETINATVTGAAGPKPVINTSGLSTNLVYWGDNSSTLGAGGLIKIADSRFGFPLKTSQPGVAFSVASDASGQATSNIRIFITGYFAP